MSLKKDLEEIAEQLNVEKQIPITAPLEDMFGCLERLAWLPDEDCLLGTVAILGVEHHVTFVRVVRGEDNILRPTRDPYDRYEDILSGDFDGSPQTVEIPGLEGEWVVGVDPYRD